MIDRFSLRLLSDNFLFKVSRLRLQRNPRDYLRRLNEQIDKVEKERYAAKKKRGTKPRQRLKVRHYESQQSITDPDSGMLKRPDKPSGFHYLCHQSADIKYGIITDIYVTSGNRNVFNI